MDGLLKTGQSINFCTFPGKILLQMIGEAQLETKLSKQREMLRVLNRTG